MARPIIIVENSGEGKRYITDYLLSKCTFDTMLVKKYTTRLSRKSEDITDLIFDVSDKMKNCTYIYGRNENYYGIQKEDIDSVLNNNMNPIIFVTNVNVILNLKKDYPNTLVIYIFDMILNSGIGDNDNLLYKIQENRFSAGAEYTRMKIYDYCVVNNFDDMFVQQLRFILEHELNKKTLKDGVTVFLSYNWNDKEKVDEVDRYLSQKENITVVRDVRNISPWGRIKEFMKSIRDQEYAVLFISDMFLKSPNCMYEILELMKEKDYEKRIFPVVLNNSIYSPLVRLEYIQYWQNRYDELEKLIDSIQITNLGKILDELKRYKLILSSMDDFISAVIDMNNPQFENIGEKIYGQIFDTI